MDFLKNYPYGTEEDVEEFLKRHPHATKGDMVKLFLCAGPDAENMVKSLRRRVLGEAFPFNVLSFLDASADSISTARDTEKRKGREHVEAGPLLQVHSVHVQPKGDLENGSLPVYGKIRVKYEHFLSGDPLQLDVYSRSAEDPDYISPSGGYLTLGWVDPFSCDHCSLWMELHGTTIEVDLYLKIGDAGILFARESFLVGGTTEGDVEELKSKEFPHALCFATLSYIKMPFAALCRVDIRLSSRSEGLVVDLVGKIVARYKNTFGNYNSEPCLLFEKQNGFDPLDMNGKLCLSRRWLGLPAYSSLEVDLDLTDFNTGNKLINEKVQVLDGNGGFARENAVDVGDFAIIVDVGLFPCPRMGNAGSDCDPEETIRLLKSYLTSSSSDDGNRRYHDQDLKTILRPSCLAEIFSIFIGRKKKGTPLNIFGTVEFSSDGKTQYLFKRTSNDGVEVEDSQNVLPLGDVCMSFLDGSMLELKVDLKDVSGKFQNRGFATYNLAFVNHNLSYDTQLCSVFPGKDGFCALHYSMFSSAVLAKIEIILKIKSAHSGGYKIYGSAIAQYSDFDYSTKFKKDYFRSVLFKRTEKDPVQLKDNGRVPLSRCAVAVPIDSSLIIAVDFWDTSLTDHFSCEEKFKVGCCSFSTKINEHELDIKLTWSDGLHDGGRDSDVDMDCGMGGEDKAKTSIKGNQPDLRNGGSDLDEDEDCTIGGVNQTKTSLKRKQPYQNNGWTEFDEDEVLP